MAQLFYDSDADLSLLNGKTVAIVGFYDAPGKKF
jgi:ketol-acid reductoisomerase